VLRAGTAPVWAKKTFPARGWSSSGVSARALPMMLTGDRDPARAAARHPGAEPHLPGQRPRRRPLPYLVVDLRGQTRLRLDGEQRLIATGPLQTTLAGLPDVPLSSFALDVASGQASPFTLQNDLCSQPLPPLDTTLIAQNGATVSQEVPIERPACGDVPTLQVAAKRLATSHRRVTAEVDPAGGKAADRLTLTLAADLRLAPGAKARNVVARLNRKRIASSRVRLHGVHQIEVRAPHEGTLALVLDRQAIELSMAGKRRQGDATTTDLDFNALIRSDGAQQHVAATATATYR
jgi:hypothetical protein